MVAGFTLTDCARESLKECNHHASFKTSKMAEIMRSELLCPSISEILVHWRSVP